MFDFMCIYQCNNCCKYWAVSEHKRQLTCDHCGSKDREHLASIDPNVFIPQLLAADVQEASKILSEITKTHE